MKKYKNIIGWCSACLIVFGYYFLSINFLSHTSTLYNSMNLIGGIGLAYRVWLDKNYSNFILEIIFILIALKSLFI